MNINKKDLINANSRFGVSKRIKQPVDTAISKIVGKTVLATDPRLIALIVKHKAGKDAESKIPDNFMANPNFIKELKQMYDNS